MTPTPSDAEIRQILIDRIDVQRQSVGIVVGIIGPQGRRVISHGHLEKGDARGVDGDTIFEIGSATKAFTALLLADMVQRGEVKLDDPAAEYLQMPERNGRSITLLDLATHTSGLPRVPTNLPRGNPANPYKDYSAEQLYHCLASYQLTRDIGSQYEYSNLGAGLLGHVLARRAGVDFETLVRTRICDLLGMPDTRITLNAEMNTRLAAGHNPALDTVANWDLPTLAGAGALRSTVNDLLTFLAAHLGYVHSPLAAAMAATLKIRRSTGQPGLDVALGWHVSTNNEKEIVWHNGGTGGYRSFVGFDRKTGIGVVALSNAFTLAGVDDIARHLLDPEIPLMQPPKERQTVTVDPKIFDAYLGDYQLTPAFILSITCESHRLFVQASGQQRLELFAQGERDYFLKAVEAQIVFVTGEDGRATELVLHQNGRDQRARRVAD